MSIDKQVIITAAKNKVQLYNKLTSNYHWERVTPKSFSELGFLKLQVGPLNVKRADELMMDLNENSIPYDIKEYIPPPSAPEL